MSGDDAVSEDVARESEVNENDGFDSDRAVSGLAQVIALHERQKHENDAETEEFSSEVDASGTSGMNTDAAVANRKSASLMRRQPEIEDEEHKFLTELKPTYGPDGTPPTPSETNNANQPHHTEINTDEINTDSNQQQYTKSEPETSPPSNLQTASSEETSSPQLKADGIVSSDPNDIDTQRVTADVMNRLKKQEVDRIHDANIDGMKLMKKDKYKMAGGEDVSEMEEITEQKIEKEAIIEKHYTQMEMSSGVKLLGSLVMVLITLFIAFWFLDYVNKVFYHMSVADSMQRKRDEIFNRENNTVNRQAARYQHIAQRILDCFDGIYRPKYPTSPDAILLQREYEFYREQAVLSISVFG